MNIVPNRRTLCRLGAAVLVLVAAGANVARAQDDPYADHISKTDPLSPEQEREKLHVPAGLR